MLYPLFFRDEFKQWLITSNVVSSSSGSADSYASYVAGVNHQFSIQGTSMCDLIEKYYKADDSKRIHETISAFQTKLYLSNICQITGKAKGTIDNWRTGLLKYKEFFSEITSFVEPEETDTTFTEVDTEVKIVFGESQNVTTELVQPFKEIRTYTYVYDKKALKKNFTFRIITQDRFYGETFFPISFIKSYLYKNGYKIYFDNWVNNQLDDIEILYEGGILNFKDISELRINTSKEKSEVTILAKTGVKTVLSSNSLGTKQFPLTSPNIEWISLDHVSPMKTMLSENAMVLPQLKSITEQFKKIAGPKATQKKYKATGTVLLRQTPMFEIDIDLLKKELGIIKSFTKLQLMDKIENNKKKAR